MEGDNGGAAVAADGLGLEGPRGTVFEGVALHAEPGSLIVVQGPSGSGRTALLLTLTGRMRPGTGTAEVAGHRLPRRAPAVRRLAALGPVPGITDPEPAHTVSEGLRERALLLRRFGRPLRGLLASPRRRAVETRDREEAALAAAGLDPGALPKGPRTRIRDLDRPQQFRLGVALALLGGPRLLAADDVGLRLEEAEEAGIWSMLTAVAAAGTTVLAVGVPPRPESLGEVPLVTVPTGRRTGEAA